MRRTHRETFPLERAAVAHAALLYLGTTWAFGGNADFVQPYLGAWASLAVILTAAYFHRREASARRTAIRCLAPFALFNGLTLVALATPGFREIHFGSELMLLPRYVPAWLPSSATPHLAIHVLWLFDAFFLTAFNLFVLVQHRRRLRGLLLLVLLNSLALAVFGTLQKLLHSPGLFFGLVHSPQEYFFASFIYNNHWGAYCILAVAASLALMWRFADHADERGFFHSPGFGAAVAILAIAITVPLSGARICSALLVLLLLADFGSWSRRQVRGEPGRRGGGWRAVLVGCAVLAAGAGAAWFVGRDMITQRISKTADQLHDMRQHGLGQRATLYRDTWRMARARLGFGWGAGSYPHVFQLYNTARPDPRDHLPIFDHDAHTDWLQSVAEHGLAGTAALALCAIVPLGLAGADAWRNRLSRRLLAGCAIVLTYAIVEFPFGNWAVVLTWWMLFFSALAYGRLSPRDGRSSPSPLPEAPSAEA